MRSVDTLMVELIIRLFPSSFRNRFGDEMLAAFLDQRDALVRHDHAPLSSLRHSARTIAGLLRALIATWISHRRRPEVSVPHRPQRSTPMRSFFFDVRHALRVFRAKPVFTTVAVVTLALGIGANTAVFSVVNSVILAPLPYDEPEQLVRLYTASKADPDERQFLAGFDLMEVREQVDAFASLAIMYTYREMGLDLEARDGIPQRIPVLPVSAEYFQTLRATPLLGRAFTREEERSDTRRVILSHGLWSTFAARDSSVVGRTVQLSGEAYEIIGVMRPSFTDVVSGDVAAWVPLNLQPGGSNNRWNHYLTAIGRLRPGGSLALAQSQLSAVMLRQEAENPDSHRDRRMHAVPLHEDVVGPSVTAVYVLMGAAGLVLLIACLNVANLFLTRSVAQSRDTAIRTALGALRTRLIAERLTEALVVALAGGALGSAVAYWGVKLLLAVSPESLARAEEVRSDPMLLAFALGVTVLTGLLFGAAPAYRASRADPSHALHDGARGNTGGRGSRQTRNVLVATQVSVALVLLVGAGVLIRSFVARQHVDLGFDAHDVATFEIHLPTSRYKEPERRVQFHSIFQDRLRALAGVERVGATSWLPANGPYHVWGYQYVDDKGADGSIAAQVRVVDGDFLETLRIPLRKGRAFGPADRLGTDGVALISRSVAEKAYGTREALGQRFQTSGDSFTVVGVVDDVATEANGTSLRTIYLSHDQYAADRQWALTYVVRARGTQAAILDAARRELSNVDPALVLHRPRSFETVLARHQARHRFTLLLMATFAAIALTLAAVGIYGVLSYAVSQRTHEIGVRVALGAKPAAVRAIVMRQGLAVAGIGMAVGLPGAWAMGGLLRTLAFGVTPRDPLVFVSVTMVIGVVVLVAAYVPARRATRVDPLRALRSD
jgi:putative ABC transport system permease protein